MLLVHAYSLMVKMRLNLDKVDIYWYMKDRSHKPTPINVQRALHWDMKKKRGGAGGKGHWHLTWRLAITHIQFHFLHVLKVQGP